MNVVILGAGRRGLRLAQHLTQENKVVVFLDSNQERCAAAVAKLDCLAICGSATDIEKLKEAGCDKADAVIAVTDSDEVNLVSCGIVSSEWPNVDTIAAIRALSYLGKSGYNKKILGISHIVNPEQEAASRISGIIQSGLYSDTIYFKDAEFILFKSTIESDSQLIAKSLMEIKKDFAGQYVIAGIKRKGKTFTPSGTTVLEPNDEVAIVSDDALSAEIFNIFGGKATRRLKKIVIIGGTRIAAYLLELLPKRLLKNITLIEKDPDICKNFTEEFSQILIINGSITDEQLWDEESIQKSDLLISVTENDELNIITASYAKKAGVRKAIALLKSNTNYLGFARSLDIDAPISTTEATVDTLLKFLRGNDISTLHTLFEGELEVYEYVLKPTFKELGKQLKDVQLLGKCIIAGVKSANGTNFVPDGSYTFKEGDTLLVAATHACYDFVTEFFS